MQKHIKRIDSPSVCISPVIIYRIFICDDIVIMKLFRLVIPMVIGIFNGINQLSLLFSQLSILAINNCHIAHVGGNGLTDQQVHVSGYTETGLDS